MNEQKRENIHQGEHFQTIVTKSPEKAANNTRLTISSNEKESRAAPSTLSKDQQHIFDRDTLPAAPGGAGAE